MDGISKTTFSPSSINNGAMKSLGVSIVSATILLMEALLRNIRFRFCKYISLNLKFKIKSHFFFFHFVSISNLLGSGKPATIHLLCFQRMVDNLSLIHISEPTRQAEISYAVFCLKKK